MNIAFKTPRAICTNCHETLPRAALSRCPMCRAPILRAIDVGMLICRRCNNEIPQAHAGKCPSCSTAQRRTGPMTMQRRLG